MERVDGRRPDQLRPLELIPDYIRYPEGSILISMGATRVLCNVTIQKGVPRWMEQQGVEGGWITAEYALLPRATHQRTRRETDGLRGRTQEIRRLIGRSLRAGFRLDKLGSRTCIVDCDVIQADGGTRTAAVTGGYLALALAIQRLVQTSEVSPEVFASPVAAVSVGLVKGEALLDLCYQEDMAAEVDINVVMNARGEYIELQGTAEGGPFTRSQLDGLLDLAASGIAQLLAEQQGVISAIAST